MEGLIVADEEARKLLDEASEITMNDYKDYSIESLICAVEDLLCEVNDLNEKIEQIEQDIEDNYRPISRAEEIGYDESDFI